MEKQKSLPHFPFYPSDFLAKTGRLTDEQVGAYIRLLCEQWIAGDIPIANASANASALRMLCESAETSWPFISKYFESSDGGMKNPRMEKVRLKAIDIYTKRVKAAESRWVSEDASANASASAAQNSKLITTKLKTENTELKEILSYFPDSFFPSMTIPNLLLDVKNKHGLDALRAVSEKVAIITDKKKLTGAYVCGIIKNMDLAGIAKGTVNKSGDALEWFTRTLCASMAEKSKSNKTTDELFRALKDEKGNNITFETGHRYEGQPVWVKK